MLFNTVATRIDRLILYSMHRRMPVSFRRIDGSEPTFEEVLADTAVDTGRTPADSVYAPGVRPVRLRSLGEVLDCRVRVKLSDDPTAPLVIYHHGFSELPYYSSWQRIFRRPFPFPVNTVCIQAPFHNRWGEPFREAFASVRRVYQTFAGSLRIMELVQRQFEANGSAFTVPAGVSWGGVTSMLYAGMFGGVRAVVPMLSSPNLAQVLWDAAELVSVPINITREQLDSLFDFTPRCSGYDPDRVFPLMGDADVFFRLDKHAAHFGRAPVVIPRAHVLTLYGVQPLREQIIETLRWAKANPLP